MAETDGDKTQDATPHRRQQAREEGQVAKSQDLASAALLLVGLASLLWWGGSLVEMLARYAIEQLGGEAWLTADPQFCHRPRPARGLRPGLLSAADSCRAHVHGHRGKLPAGRLSFSAGEAGPGLDAAGPLARFCAALLAGEPGAVGDGALEDGAGGRRGVCQPVWTAREDPGPGRDVDAGDRDLCRAGPDLDEHEDRHGLAAAGGLGLWLSMVEAPARPADDDAGGPRGVEEPGGQSADGRAAEAGPAATGAAPHLYRGAQGRRRDHQPDRVGHRHPVRSARRWPRRSWWPRGPA